MSSIISIPIPNNRKISNNSLSKINDLNYSANSTLTTTSTTTTDNMDDFYTVLIPDSKRSKNNESNCCYSYNSTPATPSLSSVLLSKKGSIKSSYSHLYNFTLNCSSSTYTYSSNQNINNNHNNNKNSLIKSCNSFNCCSTTVDEQSVPSVCESFDSTFSIDNSMSEYGGYSASLRSGVSWSKKSFVNTLFENSNNCHPLMEDDDDLTYEEQNSNMLSIDLLDNSIKNNNNSIIGSNQSEMSMDDCVSVSTSISSSSTNVQRLLHDHLIQDEKCKQHLLKPSKSQKFVSNLSKSFQFISSLASSSKRATVFDANNLLSFDARSTDDRLPVLENIEQIQQENILEEEEKEEFSSEEQKIEQEIPLITFDSITSPSKIQNKCITMTYHPNINSNRSREPRINSNFLRFYAHDYSIKSNGLLGVTDYEIDLFQEEEAKRYYQTECQENGDDEFDLSSESSIDSTSNYYKNLSDEDKDDEDDDEDDEDDDEMTGYNHTREMISYKDRLKIGLLSREKLWSSVILPPRDDTIDDHSIFRNKYIHMNNNDLYSTPKSSSSLTRMNGGVMPWVNCYNYNSRKNQTCLKPYGFLTNQTQFTVKGWANQRWVAQTSN
ncbi:hypothetical protein B5S31_g1271 [[Candida] boidinii]|nr:hypothetical protein B5S31_g1271 [[Candida] boidinii]OWB76348.1 hypothetical protein B5S32_g499 [[Candida] boidinii]